MRPTMNDWGYNPSPLKEIPIGQGEIPDDVSEEELREGFRRNKELIESLEREYEERMSTMRNTAVS